MWKTHKSSIVINKSFLLFLLLSVIVDHAPPETVDSSLHHLHVPGGGEHPDEDADHEGQDHEGEHDAAELDTLVFLASDLLPGLLLLLSGRNIDDDKLFLEFVGRISRLGGH